MSWKPEREIEIVAGTPPGGGLDRSARALARAIEANALVDVPVKVVNVGGDGGRKAWVHMERYAGDGHVVGISSPNMAADYLTGVTKSDPDRFAPLAILYSEYIAFVVDADSTSAWRRRPAGAIRAQRRRRDDRALDLARQHQPRRRRQGDPPCRRRHQGAGHPRVRHRARCGRRRRRRQRRCRRDHRGELRARDRGRTAAHHRHLGAGAAARSLCSGADLDRAGRRLHRGLLARRQRAARARSRADSVLAGRARRRDPDARNGRPTSPGISGPKCISTATRCYDHLRRERTEMRAILADLGLLSG